MRARKDFAQYYDISINFTSNPIRSVSNKGKNRKKPLFVFPYYAKNPATEKFCKLVFFFLQLFHYFLSYL